MCIVVIVMQRVVHDWRPERRVVSQEQKDELELQVGVVRYV
jgi:hypothetical protein